ncbi:MAG TPA: zf-HC2 domain-containing protein [Terriglobales bacterium]|jgi:anti-sigma factor RsiW|nr:zf-HC2 domain-containing protein [Terriglobales bacterium]
MDTESKHGTPCSEYETLLAEAVEGNLAEPQRAGFQAHVAACPHCGPLFTEAQAGRRLLRALAELEPPRNLVHNILAATSGKEAARPAGEAPGWARRLWEPLAPVLSPVWATVRQPRFAMSFGMAFFSVTLVLNLVGVKLTDLRLVDLKPSAMRYNAERALDETTARATKYYENIRLVYEFQSRLRDLRNAAEPEAQPPAPAPKQERQKRNHDTSGKPDPKDQNYSQERGGVVMAAAPWPSTPLVPVPGNRDRRTI